MGIELDDLKHLPRVDPICGFGIPEELAEVGLYETDDRTQDNMRLHPLYVVGVLVRGKCLIYCTNRPDNKNEHARTQRQPFNNIHSYRTIEKIS